MHSDQVVAADELVQLDVVDMTTLAELRCVQHGEHVVGVDVDLGHVVALNAIVHRDPVEAEHRRQHLDGDLVAWTLTRPRGGRTSTRARAPASRPRTCPGRPDGPYRVSAHCWRGCRPLDQVLGTHTVVRADNGPIVITVVSVPAEIVLHGAV